MLRILDINECLSPTSNDCDGLITSCNNTDGSYTCLCNPGYIQSENDTCEGELECSTQTMC